MPGLTMHPYAITQRWDFSRARSLPASILADFLQTLAGECAASGPSSIGYIKAKGSYQHGKHLTVSVVAADVPATLEGFAPPQCSDMDVALSMMIYGLEPEVLDRLIRQVAQEMAAKWQVRIT